MQWNIRSAEAGEAQFLTELALRSKSHWGYDQAFLKDCRVDLTITSDYITSHPVFVVEENGRAVGFYSLEPQSDCDVELMHLFVEPAAIGNGHGGHLWSHAVEKARELGFQEMVIGSDPFAEPFYKAMGARHVGEVASIVRPGRMLPLLRFTLAYNAVL